MTKFNHNVRVSAQKILLLNTKLAEKNKIVMQLILMKEALLQ